MEDFKHILFMFYTHGVNTEHQQQRGPLDQTLQLVSGAHKQLQPEHEQRAHSCNFLVFSAFIGISNDTSGGKM